MKTVPALDPALGIIPAGTQIIFAAGTVVTFPAGAPHGGDAKIPWLYPLHFLADLFNSAKVLVTENEVIVSLQGLPIESLVDLAVRAAQAHPVYLDRDLVWLQHRVWHIAHVDAVLLTWMNHNRFHS